MTRRFLSAAVAAFALQLAACSPSAPAPSTVDRAGGDASGSDVDIVKGPHGGRLLRDGDFALEVTIFERGGPPEFRLYPMQAGKPVVPQEVQADITLRRINGLDGGVTEPHVFIPKDDYLLSTAEVVEPHSFAVTVQARHAGQTHEWRYDSPEGRVTIAADMAATAGLETAATTSGLLRETLALYGSIQPDPERVREVTARFAGVVKSVGANVGDRVRKGQTLATVESNESLQVYAVTAPIAGTLIARSTNPGESAGSAPLFGIADFSSVRAELGAFPRDRGRLKPGQSVTVTAADGKAHGSGRIGFVSPVGTASQALSARVPLDNGDGRWTPGQFVEARITVGESQVAQVIPVAALQTFRDQDVVFVNEGERYQAQPVTLGRRDDDHVEVLGGLAAGARVVVANSYLVKADIEKSGASHDH